MTPLQDATLTSRKVLLKVPKGEQVAQRGFKKTANSQMVSSAGA